MRPNIHLGLLYRGIAAVSMLGLGLTQTGGFGSSSPLEGPLQALSAVLLPPAALLLSRREGFWIAAVAASTLLFGVVRLASPRPMPGLLWLAGFQVVVLYLLLRALWTRRRGHSVREVRS